MPTLSITATNFVFPYKSNNGTVQHTVTKKQCLKYATVVGNSHFSGAFGRTQTALALAAYRAMAVRCVIDFGYASLQPRAEYTQLEPSEKINLSYWIGMTFTAIAADRILKVPRLTHALRQHGLVKSKKTKSLADLVGRDSRKRWHVLEAKGRQTVPDAKARRAFKRQARTVRSINGANVATRSYCIGLLSTPCHIELVDPPPPRRDPVDLKIDPAAIGTGYYEPFIEFLQSDARPVTSGGRTAIVRPILYDPIDMEVIYMGLEEQLLSAIKGRGTIPFQIAEHEDSLLYVARDGVAVASSKGPCDL